MRLGLISLGCDKNTVDSERMLAELVGHGAEPTDVDEAEVILVNTCGFIDAAKEESIETILEAERLKREGACRGVVAVGCMVERYREEMVESLPEVDLLLGLRDLDRLVPELRERGLLRGPAPARVVHPGERIPVGARHVRYLKVSEGCDHGCAFCAIPLWRGKHRSFELERLVAEAQRLEAQGAVEVNLVAQDLAHWGRERRDGTDIATLVEALLRETSIPWFRLLYIYSAGLREPLIELMASETRLLSYIDMPIQHASDTVLHRMRRPERAATLRSKIAWLRETIPDLTLRTTVLVGFPGETGAEFRELVDFLDEVPFDRLGAFAFSPQEGTRAAAMEESFVPAELARDRLEEVLEVQRAVSRERLAAEVGRERVAVVDAPAAPDDPTLALLYDDPPAAAHLGRVESQADDVDGATVLVGGNGLVPGSLVRVEIERAADFDLAGRVRDVVRPASGRGGAAPSPALPSGRGLPVLGLDSAWGR
ncbi:MAG: 30S ribosomal protein S12 methylthiotransferase RimO [Gemmatimonadota bacterium]|uniref:30S ribosomal protein S12 methylthiotransferase RimO n=1 Tax=Candidatus Palauibacter scopulicola TaxID=3056741 RepID=UPI0023A2372D|nr:30S ribosomal protein S12 methylthiotransferase RimO [Candidatus Palauibacter scopulicola]MDE2662293.1 30S ribosomal protein S12 methylthiotransferase RimO [Candidatus Palauibacter scopulicola]